MPIIGLTHDAEGNVRLRRTVTTKVAIGLAPDPNDPRGHPTRLDHFVVLQKATRDGQVVWEQDAEKQEHYEKQCGGPPRELWIIFLDDDPDVVFRTEYAWWVKTGRKCWGDGEAATRRTEKNPDGEAWTPCANHVCPDIERGDCKPSADLYFMLADYPSLGTCARLHTSSYTSIAEIRSALEDLRAVTGGRLMGLRVKLFVRPEKNVYDAPDPKDRGRMMRVTGTKWVLGLELAATDLPKLVESVAETAKIFQEIRRQLGGRRIELVEDETERAPEIEREFYPAERILPAAPAGVPKAQIPSAPPPEVLKAGELMDRLKLNQAARSMLYGQYGENVARLIAHLEAQLKSSPAAEQPATKPESSRRKSPTKGGGTPREESPLPPQAPAKPSEGFDF